MVKLHGNAIRTFLGRINDQIRRLKDFKCTHVNKKELTSSFKRRLIIFTPPFSFISSLDDFNNSKASNREDVTPEDFVIDSSFILNLYHFFQQKLTTSSNDHLKFLTHMVMAYILWCYYYNNHFKNNLSKKKNL